MPQSGLEEEAMDEARTHSRDSAWRRQAVAGVFFCLFLLAGGALADPWYVHYENAERALREERWADAVAEIQEALERKGDSGSRVRTYGMRVVDYFPYLKLGIAYHHLGQPAAAREAFDTEERLGAVAASPEALAELERYRRLATEATEAPRRRVEDVLRESLAEARRLEAAGRPEEAMTALAPGLAAAPEDAEALDLMDDLRGRVAAEQQRRRRAEQSRQDLERARTLLSRGAAEAAAGLLRQVLAAGANPEASRLLEQARQAIAASLAEAERQEEREAQITAALTAARRLEAAGNFEEALGRLERIFAVEPAHAEANRLRERLLAAQERSRQTALVAQTLAEAEGEFAAGRFEEALTAANRVLALDLGNTAALDLVRRAYGEISRQLLGTAPEENLPPAIRFADQRQQVDGELLELLATPELRLSGVVIDRSPVDLEFLDGEGRVLPGTATGQEVGDLVITEFRLHHRLTPGPATVTVIATDAAGSSTRADYRVLYRRPWYLAPWLAATAAGLVLALLGLFLWRRHRQRRALLRRRFNPYVAGGPIFDSRLFFGREPLVQKILQTVHNNSLLLHGERRIGKTSLLHQLHRRLEALDDPQYRFLPVYVDLQGTPEEKFFATLADQIFDSLHPGAQRDSALSRPSYSHHELVRELHGLLEKLQAASPKRVKVVLLIDEVDELNRYDPRVNQGLRSLFMKRFAENLAAVVAGVGIRREWEQEGSPWYNFFEEIEVEAIAPDEAWRLVVEPVREVFRFEPGAAERIVEIAEGRPFLIQRHCLALVGRLHEEGRRTVTLADVETVRTP